MSEGMSRLHQYDPGAEAHIRIFVTKDKYYTVVLGTQTPIRMSDLIVSKKWDNESSMEEPNMRVVRGEKDRSYEAAYRFFQTSEICTRSR